MAPTNVDVKQSIESDVQDMKVKENVADLNGLAVGLVIAKEGKNGKVKDKMIETIDNFSNAINRLQDEYEELRGYIEGVDSDLADMYEDM